jgi:hypothetical protein
MPKKVLVSMVEFTRVRLSLAVRDTAPDAPANAECVSMVESVKEAVSEAVMLTAPPWPLPVAVFWIATPSIWRFPTMICTSAPRSAPVFEEMIELFGLSEIVPGAPALRAVVRTASFTERTNCPSRIETVFAPLMLTVEPGARVIDPKEEKVASFTFGSGWSVTASNSPGDPALAS